MMSVIFNKNSGKPGGFCAAYEFEELSLFFFKFTFPNTIRILFLIVNYFGPKMSTGAARARHSFLWLPLPVPEIRRNVLTFLGSWTRPSFLPHIFFFLNILSLSFYLYPQTLRKDRHLSWVISSFPVFFQNCKRGLLALLTLLLCLVWLVVISREYFGSNRDCLSHLTAPLTKQK